MLKRRRQCLLSNKFSVRNQEFPPFCLVLFPGVFSCDERAPSFASVAQKCGRGQGVTTPVVPDCSPWVYNLAERMHLPGPACPKDFPSCVSTASLPQAAVLLEQERQQEIAKMGTPVPRPPQDLGQIGVRPPLGARGKALEGKGKEGD